MHEIVRGLINWLVSGLIEGTVEAANGLGDVEDVRRNNTRVAHFSLETAAGSQELKDFLRRKVYQSDRLAEDRKQSAEMIANLFEFFMEHPNRLPINYLEESSGQPLHRAVCDYIAGMTDGFLIRTCEQMKLL
jgi:dGTPase